jgi:hypothetical protein
MMHQKEFSLFDDIEPMLLQGLESNGHARAQFMNLPTNGHFYSTGENQTDFRCVFMMLGFRDLPGATFGPDTKDLEIGEPDMGNLDSILSECLDGGLFTVGHFSKPN